LKTLKTKSGWVVKKVGKLVCFKVEDFDYLCSKIEWGKSWLDAKAIRILNEPMYKENIWEDTEDGSKKG